MSRIIRTRRGQRRTMAATLLEFVLLLPMVLFLMLFIFDMSRVLMVSGTAQDATYRAARAGAAYGGADPDGTQPSREAFNLTLDELPGGSGVVEPLFVIEAGTVCDLGDQYVEVRVDYGVDLMSPGLGRFLNIMNGEGWSDGGFRMSSSAVARCEVAG